MPCDAGWTHAPRSTRGKTPFRECRCATNDGAADAGTRVSSEAPIARLFVRVGLIFRGTSRTATKTSSGYIRDLGTLLCLPSTTGEK